MLALFAGLILSSCARADSPVRYPGTYKARTITWIATHDVCGTLKKHSDQGCWTGMIAVAVMNFTTDECLIITQVPKHWEDTAAWEAVKHEAGHCTDFNWHR